MPTEERPHVLVTGGAKRVGAEIVRAFARKGAAVIIHYGNSQREAETLPFGIPVSIVVTKTDKVAKTKRNTEVARIRRALKEHAPETFIQVSSELRTGKDELCDDIERYLVE